MSRSWRRRMKETLGYVPKHKRFFGDIRICPTCTSGKPKEDLTDWEKRHIEHHKRNPYTPRGSI